MTWDEFRKKRSDWMIKKMDFDNEKKYPKNFQKIIRFFNEKVVGFITGIAIFFIMLKGFLKLNELKGFEVTVITLLLVILFTLRVSKNK